MTALHSGEIDGVRCFWVDTGRPTLQASLMFRAGFADESFHESGWLHLIEHSVLHGRGGGALQINGQVGALMSTFDAHGPAEDVARHLSEVTAWLADPVFTDLDRERGVLQAEAALRASVGGRTLTWRYGAQGLGLAGYPDHALGRATPELLRQRSRVVHTTGNAVLALDGPPPASLRLHLPSGEPMRVPGAPPGERTPAIYPEQAGLVVSGVVPRSVGATVVPALLERVLREHYRDEVGASYAPWSAYEHADADHAVVMAGCDLSAPHRDDADATALRLVRRLARDGAPEAWVEEHRAVLLQSVRDPFAAAGVAYRAAGSVLAGRDAQSFEEVVAEIEQVSATEVHEAITSLADTLLVGTPGQHTAMDVPVLSAPMYSTRYARHGHRSRSWPADDSRFAVMPDIVEVSDGLTARQMAIRDVAGMLTFPDGARHLIDHRGWGLTLEPEAWHRGATLITHLDRAVPAQLHLPQPARHDLQPLPRAGLWQRFRVPISVALVIALYLLIYLVRQVSG